jgi:hypothetical protein
LFLHFE